MKRLGFPPIETVLWWLLVLALAYLVGATIASVI